MVRIAETMEAVRETLAPARRSGQRIGFVPTMGALHEGHWSLIERCRKECATCVVSIFVNPLQFGPKEDLAAYPRPREVDLAGCAERDVDLVFAPSVAVMYPEEVLTRVSVPELAAPLCGRHRPGHFDGVATVVAKLFAIVQPDAAYFGEKDYQQLVLVRRMVADLSMPIQVLASPTVRERDGLAMSSRNAYLSAEERAQAPAICAGLREAVRAAAGGERDAGRLIGIVTERLHAAGITRIDYVSIVDPQTLRDVETVEGQARLCVAVRVGNTRLIDNVAVGGDNGVQSAKFKVQS